MKRFSVPGVLLPLMLLAAPAGDVLAKTSCHVINAKGIGQDLGEGMTEARIIGGGLLQGTTEAQFVITDFSNPPVFPFEGGLTFTVNRATLSVDLVGTFDVSTGVFTASADVVDATGKLEGATGVLLFDGIQNLADGSFVEVVTGQICVDLSPR